MKIRGHEVYLQSFTIDTRINSREIKLSSGRSNYRVRTTDPLDFVSTMEFNFDSHTNAIAFVNDIEQYITNTHIMELDPTDINPFGGELLVGYPGYVIWVMDNPSIRVISSSQTQVIMETKLDKTNITYPVDYDPNWMDTAVYQWSFDDLKTVGVNHLDTFTSDVTQSTPRLTARRAIWNLNLTPSEYIEFRKFFFHNNRYDTFIYNSKQESFDIGDEIRITDWSIKYAGYLYEIKLDVEVI